MARRAGSLATERTDYSDRLLFPGARIDVPEPFVRLEDFVFTSYDALLPPTTATVSLIIGRQSDEAPARLDQTTALMLEAELTNCVAVRPMADNEVATGKLRLAILWGRLADIAADAAQERRAIAAESYHYREAVADLFREQDPHFAIFGFRYGWAGTMLLERFAETSGIHPVAEDAWGRAAAKHEDAAVTAPGRKLRRMHEKMAAICSAHQKAVAMAREQQRQLVGRGESVVRLRGRGAGAHSERA